MSKTESMKPFIDYVCNRLREFDEDAIPTPSTLDEFNQFICDVLDDYNHVVILYNSVNKLKQTKEQLKSRKNELNNLIPDLV